MTLIGQMHSLGRGEGRVGYCWTAREHALTSRQNGLQSPCKWKPCPRTEQPLGVFRMVWPVGWEAPPKLSLLTTLLVFYNSSMEACYQKPEGEKKQRRTREIYTDRKKQRRRQGGKEGETGTMGSDVKMSNDSLKDHSPSKTKTKTKPKERKTNKENPSNPTTITTTKSKSWEKMFSFATASWYCFYRGWSTRG